MKIFRGILLQPYTAPLLWTTYYLIHSISKYQNYFSWAYDLGIYTNTVYQYSIGKLAYSHIINMLMLANNFEPILILISPIYKLFPSPLTLLILQALCVGLSIYFISHCIAKITQHQLATNILTNLYASSIGILYAINYDFHPTTIAVLPLSVLLYSYFLHKPKLYWYTLFFSLLFRQDIPIYITGLGLYQLHQKQYRKGLLSITIALSVFSLIQFIIFPAITSNPDNQYSAISRFQSSKLPSLVDPFSFASTLVSPPIKLQNSLLLFSQYLFAPLFSFFTYLTVMPYLVLRYTSNYEMVWTYLIYHNATLEPFLVLSAAFAFTKARPHFHKLKSQQSSYLYPLAKYTVLATILCIKLPILLLFSSYTALFVMSSNNYPHLKALNDYLPINSKVAAQSELVSLLANREYLYLFPSINEAEYLILDSSLPSANWHLNHEETGMFDQKTYQEKKASSIDGNWQIVYQAKTLTIYKRTLFD